MKDLQSKIERVQELIAQRQAIDAELGELLGGSGTERKVRGGG